MASCRSHSILDDRADADTLSPEALKEALAGRSVNVSPSTALALLRELRPLLSSRLSSRRPSREPRADGTGNGDRRPSPADGSSRCAAAARLDLPYHLGWSERLVRRPAHAWTLPWVVAIVRRRTAASRVVRRLRAECRGARIPHPERPIDPSRWAGSREEAMVATDSAEIEATASEVAAVPTGDPSILGLPSFVVGAVALSLATVGY